MSHQPVRRRLLLAAAPLLGAVAVPWAVSPVLAQTDESGAETAESRGRSINPLLTLPAFRMVVPHRTQKDGSRWQTSNCGPATLGMLLDGYGISGQDTDDLRFRMHTYQGTVGMRTGTGLEHVAHVAEDLGLETHGLYDAGGSYRTWSLEQITAELRQGRPVMPLVRLYLVPGYEALGSRWGHYILLTGITSSGFTFSDSLKTDPAAGTSGLISTTQLGLAMGNSHIPGQAAAFAGPRPLPVATPG